MGLIGQTWTLTRKNILIALYRHAFSTAIRAFILPVAFIVFLSYSRNLFVPADTFGIGSAHPVRSLQEGLHASSGGRDNVVFVNNGLSGGDIDKVIDILADSVTSAGKTAIRTEQEEDLLRTCKSSLRGVTRCYGAVVFQSSPNEGTGGLWNYTIRADGALGEKIDVTSNMNDFEVYLIPIQHAVDFAIASVNTTIDQTVLPSTINEYVYTDETEAERNTDIRVAFQGSIINVLGIGFLIGMVGVTYQLTGFMASERELGMSQLIEAMMPNLRRWEPQLARFLSYHISFTIIYFPGWLIMSLVLCQGVWTNSKAVVIILHILTGLALTSSALLGGAFFQKAQLSGITITLATLLLGVLAQVLDKQLSSAAVIILSFLFTPCAYVFFIIIMARFERHDTGTNLLHSAPSAWPFPGIILWVFLIIQIFAYPIIGFYVERYLYGASSKGRTVSKGANSEPSEGTKETVQLSNFTKHYPPSFVQQQLGKITKHPKEPVVAVNDLTLSAGKGQILVLLGANGSGKSTTLDAIAGINSITSGTITVDGTGGLGLAPQKNVMWDDVTVEEHIHIFNRLKSTTGFDSKDVRRELINAIDLDRKLTSKAKTLSGGQKRKLQLGMMFTGGSAVCCVDEVSSGLDPLSRRKIWDILLAERGSRTIIMTTHFLDEADLLADRIAIMSKGSLKAEGSSVELKDRLGGGYRVHLYLYPGREPPPELEGIRRVQAFDQVTYHAATSSEAAQLVRHLEALGIEDYVLSGPTIEDVFLKLAEEIYLEAQNGGAPVPESRPGSDDRNSADNQTEKTAMSESTKDRRREGLELLSGSEIGFFKQASVLFRKRLTVLRRNYLPQLAALLIPIIAAGLVTLFIKGYDGASCTPISQVYTSKTYGLTSADNYDLLVGPSASFDNDTVSGLFTPLLPGFQFPNSSVLAQTVHYVNSTADFNQYIDQNYANITPGGIFLSDSADGTLFSYQGNDLLYDSIFVQNVLDVMLTNISISTQYTSFAIPWAPGTGNSLQLVVYFGLALGAYPCFFALYPTLERLRNVRGLQYSNGVRSLPLWLAYLSFDFVVVLIASAISVIIFAAKTSVWYHIAYLFPIFILHGVASTLWGYVASLFARSQLSAFALATGSQEVFFLVYMIAFLCTLTYAPVDKIDDDLLLVHYVVSIFTPQGSLIRALFITLNLFSTTCVGESVAPNPGGINQYGGPILYLFLQIFALFGFLLWYDSGSVLAWYRRLGKKSVVNNADAEDADVAKELERVASSTDGLRVLHLTKTFGSNTAVDNVSFGVRRSEVFALLGPNGAGKSTTISLIRGDIQPSKNGGEIFVEGIPISKHRASARSHLGVCPQFDAMDQMTVVEHLEFYARVRGVKEVDYNVQAVIRAVGLQNFSSRMAAALSGGNKRKLSLGIALMGNPSIVLLDEPSSGMDAAAKRVMWKTLENIVPGRSLLLTTHSMEEADALANRAGILARRMLAMGTADELRHKHADAFYIHLVTKSAPHTTPEEMDQLRSWVEKQFPGAVVEEKTFHGQMRFSVPAQQADMPNPEQTAPVDEDEISIAGAGGEHRGRGSQIGGLITVLEENKDALGLEFYSCSPTTLDQVFLTIVQQHQVEEENYGNPTPTPKWKRWLWRR